MEINLNPIGYVTSLYQDPNNMPIHGKTATITVSEEYKSALLHIEQNSHLWILSWFHQANRSVLQTSPNRIDPNLPTFGVFGLRSPNRPNPIALSLVKLLKVEGNTLYLENFDAIDGTPILDIKPYFEKDIIFSPTTPDIRPVNKKMKLEWFTMEAANHHQENCISSIIAVRMAVIADFYFGKIASPSLKLHVSGSKCFIDVLQGLTRARFSHPERLRVSNEEVVWFTKWSNENGFLHIYFNSSFLNTYSLEDLQELSDEELFIVKYESQQITKC